jgi:FlaA1/EpsC-like NDP-sugar epimerase
VGADGVLLALAWYLAFQVRFDEGVPARYEGFLGLDVFVVVVGVQLLVLLALGLYEHWWRYISVRDVWRAILAVTVGSIVAVVVPTCGAPSASASRAGSSPSTGFSPSRS